MVIMVLESEKLVCLTMERMVKTTLLEVVEIPRIFVSVMQVFRQLPEFRQSRVSNNIFRQFDYL